MAFTQTRKSLIGGDLNTWGAFQQGMDKLHIGTNTIEAYISAGALYLSPGMLGIYDGSQDWNVTNSAAAGVSVAGLTASCWAKLEISVVAGVVTIAITSIGGATNPASLPASFTGAYDGTKGGFYITGTKRCHSLVWINAAGVPEGVINTTGGMDGYSGYSLSDDANDVVYSFLKAGNDFFNPLNSAQVQAKNAAFNADSSLLGVRTVYGVTTGASSFAATVQAASLAKGKRIRIRKVDTGAGICTVGRTGADTFSGATAFPLRSQHDYIELESDGSNWYVLGNSSTIDSAALAASQIQTLAHGLGANPPRVHTSLLCISAELGFSVNDEEVDIPNFTDGANQQRWGITKDSTNFTTKTGAQGMVVLRKDTGAPASITMNKWDFRIRYGIVF